VSIYVSIRASEHVHTLRLTYAHVFSRMLTYAHVCSLMRTYAHLCSPMRMYAHVCARMLTYGEQVHTLRYRAVRAGDQDGAQAAISDSMSALSLSGETAAKEGGEACMHVCMYAGVCRRMPTYADI
jgi:hypothetical protein